MPKKPEIPFRGLTENDKAEKQVPAANGIHFVLFYIFALSLTMVRPTGRPAIHQRTSFTTNTPSLKSAGGFFDWRFNRLRYCK